MTKNALLPFSVLVFSIVQFSIVPIFIALDIGTEIGAQSDAMQTPVTPSGYAFSIWSVIYLWCFLFAVYQFLPANRNRADIALFRGPALLAFIGNSLWVVIAMLSAAVFLTAPVITAILIFAMIAFLRAHKGGFTGKDYWFIVPPLALLAGWIGLAVFANWAQIMTMAGVQTWMAETGLDKGMLSIPFLFGAMALAAAMIVKSRANIWYVIPPLWGLAAIIHANAFDPVRAEPYAYVAMLAACIIVTLGALWAVMRRCNACCSGKG